MSIFAGNSIRHRFILTLVSVVVFISLIFSVTTIYQNVNTIETQLDKQLIDASTLAEKSLSSALWQYNSDFVGDFVESLFLYEDIVFAKVLSGNEVIKEKSNSGFPEKDFLFFQQSARFSTKETNINFAGKTIGTIQIALTRDRIKNTILHNAAITTIFMLLMISALISTVYFISRRYIFAPLSKLENSAAEIAGGDWDADIDTSGTDEIGNLSKTFDHMIKKLKATTASRDELEREIEERIQAQEAKKQEYALSNTIIDSIPGTFYMLDVNGRYVRWNTYQRDEIVGKSESEMADANAIDTIHPDDHQSISSKIANVLENGMEETVEGRVFLRGGPAFRWLLMTGRQMIINDSPFLIGTGIDITERKLAEAEILRLNAELEQRVADRTVQLEVSNKELEAFAYSVSHDLRAPLRHIDGYVNLLVSGFRADLPDKGLHYLDTIASSAVKMGVLIDDLLQFSRTGQGEIRLESTDMNKVLQEALTTLREDTEGRSIEWGINELPSVQGDYALLRQVWVNLLGNAIKYTRPREVARITVSASREKGKIIFAVADNGVGFDMRYVHKLFGVFQRLHSTEEFEGTGIGLATAQRIIIRHGGLIWIESELNVGSTFYFTLPG